MSIADGWRALEDHFCPNSGAIKSITNAEWIEIERNIKAGNRFCRSCASWKVIAAADHICHECRIKEREAEEISELRERIKTIKCIDCGSSFVCRLYKKFELIRSFGSLPTGAVYVPGDFEFGEITLPDGRMTNGSNSWTRPDIDNLAALFYGNDYSASRDNPYQLIRYLLGAYGYFIQVCESCIANRSEYRRATAKERQRVSGQNSRARAAGLAADLTIEEWIAILEEHEHKCAYCGGPYECMEHKTPIIAGGGTTKDNVIPACNRCNADAYQQYKQTLAAD